MGQATVVLGQYLDRALTWNDQVQICINHAEMGMVLDFYQPQIEQANQVGTGVKKLGDLKAAGLAKEQGEHTIAALADVHGMWAHQE